MNEPHEDVLSTVLQFVLEVQPEIDATHEAVPREGETVLQKYVRCLRRDLFASDIEIGAACSIYQLRIAIYTFNAQERNIRIQYHGSEENKVISLCFHNHHYRGVIPHQPTSIRVRFMLLFTSFSFFQLINSILIFISLEGCPHILFKNYFGVRRRITHS